MFENPKLLSFQKDSLIPGDLLEVTSKHGWKAASCVGIGGVSNVVLAYFDSDRKEYQEIILDGMFELISMSGNLSEREGKPFWHLHAAVSDRRGQVTGGHLLSLKVALTLELTVWPHRSRQVRSYDEATGLWLLTE